MKDKVMLLVECNKGRFSVSELTEEGYEKTYSDEYNPPIDFWKDWEHPDSLDDLLQDIKRKIRS